MPITKSAKRAHRLSRRLTLRNRARKVRLEAALKAFRKSPTEAHREAAQAIVDKAKKWRIISRPRAARLVSRLYTSSQRLKKREPKKP